MISKPLHHPRDKTPPVPEADAPIISADNRRNTPADAPITTSGNGSQPQPFNAETFVHELNRAGLKVQLRLHQKYTILVSPKNLITPNMASTITENRWEIIDHLATSDRHPLDDRLRDAMSMLHFLDEELGDIDSVAANNHWQFNQARKHLGEVYEHLFAIWDSPEPLKRRKVVA